MMKTEWDYSHLAEAYLKRPEYAPSAINQILEVVGISTDGKVCDVGAGVAHLTLELAKRGLNVVAVEPNDEMRRFGTKRTAELSNVTWHEGTGEQTGQKDHAFDLVTFGSSFNVTNRPLALKETVRILKAGGWFACLWNHRLLEDPIQTEIESIIRRSIPNYNYGARREDQTEVIYESGLFKEVSQIEGLITHRQSMADCIEAWRSHATLQRQAGNQFEDVIKNIEHFLQSMGKTDIEIPYITRCWVAQVKI